MATAADGRTRVDDIDIAPAAIGLESSPSPRRDVVAVTVDDEVVLLRSGGAAHLLNATGAVIWQLLDGDTTLAELVDAFDEVLEEERAVVSEQILEFARELGCSGLLEGVAEPGSEAADDPLQGALPVGAELEPATFADFDGAPVSLDAWRGRRVLLVNWGTGCGYCHAIAPELARAQAGLGERDIDLVFTTRGDADEDRRAFEAVGLRAPVLIRTDGVDPFAGFGTPAAYLLDADGRVAEPLAYGSGEVSRLATALAGLEDADVRDEPPISDPLTPIEYLPAPRPVCGSGGGSGLQSLDGAGTRAYRLGRFHVGVRYDSPASAEMLDRLFPGCRVRDLRVPDNYSVELHPDADIWPRPFNLLVRGGAQVVRSRSIARTLRALVSYLSAETSTPDPTWWNVRAIAVVRNGTALVLPPGLRGWIKDLAPRLGRRGFAFVDAPFVFVDPATREIVVPELSVPHDASLLTESDDLLTPAREEPFVEPDRYPIVAWHLATNSGAVARITRGSAIAEAYPLVRTDDDPAAVGARLAELFTAVPAYGFVFTSPADVARRIEESTEP